MRLRLIEELYISRGLKINRDSFYAKKDIINEIISLVIIFSDYKSHYKIGTIIEVFYLDL
jgi:hypothetical protein